MSLASIKIEDLEEQFIKMGKAGIYKRLLAKEREKRCQDILKRHNQREKIIVINSETKGCECCHKIKSIKKFAHRYAKKCNSCMKKETGAKLSDS